MNISLKTKLYAKSMYSSLLIRGANEGSIPEGQKSCNTTNLSRPLYCTYSTVHEDDGWKNDLQYKYWMYTQYSVTRCFICSQSSLSMQTTWCTYYQQLYFPIGELEESFTIEV